MNGFEEAGFAAGSVTGVRWWQLLDPGRRPGEPPGPDAVLHGARDVWVPGENRAVCGGVFGWQEEAAHKAPVEDCGCGFWAYWKQSAASPVGGKCQVLGVVEGYGTTLIGELGFRCEKARILALCCMFTIKIPDPAWKAPKQESPFLWTPPEGMFNPGGSGLDMWSQITGRNLAYKAPDRAPLIEDAEALTKIEMALEERYQVPVYATPAYMLRKHPPTTDYLPQPEPEVDPEWVDPGWYAQLASWPTTQLAAKLRTLLPPGLSLARGTSADVGPAGTAQS
jgi:hypothetical protein